MSNSIAKVVILDDEIEIGEFIADVANSSGCSATAVSSLDAFMSTDGLEANCVFLDLTMPDLDGIQFIRFLSESDFTGSIVIISGAAASLLNSAKVLAMSRGLNVVGTLIKPIEIRDLEELIEKVTAADTHPDRPVLVDTDIDPATLEASIDVGEIIPYYHPKIDHRSDTVVAFEALARWKTSDGRILPPGQFIPYAIDNGLIDKLTENLLAQICKDVAALKRQGFPSCVAVNLEASSLEQLNLPERILGLLRPNGLDASTMTLEVTENGVVSELLNAMDNLLRLRMQGFKLGIDDFGTGHSTFSQLEKLPFTQLKIDRSFVSGIGTSKDAEAIIESTIGLANSLGLEIVVEGVETEQQLRFFDKFGPLIVQGYFFARPMPYLDLLGWLQERGASLPLAEAGRPA